MPIWNPILCCCREEKRLLRENSGEILQDNLAMLRRLMPIALIILSFCLLISIFGPSYVHRRPAYIASVAGCLLLNLIFRPKRFEQYALAGIYSIFSIFLGLTIFLSVSISPNAMAASIIALFCLMPSAVLDKSWRVNLMTFLFLVVHLLFAWSMKPPSVAMDDSVNGLCFVILGVLFGAYMRSIKLENYEMKHQAHIQMEIDFLTGLYNRRKMYDLLEKRCTCGADRLITGFIMLDIDHFKEYNDHLGHLAGDDCLRRIGAGLYDCAQSMPLDFFRYGGEEFLAFFYGDGTEDLAATADALRCLIWSLNISFPGSAEGRVTVSVGFASTEQNNGSVNDRLIGMADNALYQAKACGRNRCIAYTL